MLRRAGSGKTWSMVWRRSRPSSLISEILPAAWARRPGTARERMPEPLRNQLAEARQHPKATQGQIAALPRQKVYAATVHFGTGDVWGQARWRTATANSCLATWRCRSAGRRELGPGGLSLVRGMPATSISPRTTLRSDRRAALARWLSARENPLTWRSIVNRLWLYHFGRGLVDTPNDFGRMGQTPSHPELLDWLAVEFRDGGQSLKQLHRLLVTSSVYRQSSVGRAAAEKGLG